MSNAFFRYLSVAAAAGMLLHGLTVLGDDFPLHLSSRRHVDARIGLPADRMFPDWEARAGRSRAFPTEPRGRDDGGEPAASLYRVPGEFEPQQLLVLSCGELTPVHAHTLAEIAVAARRYVHVVILVSREEQRGALIRSLSQRTATLENISLVGLPHDTRWIRDFGPTVLRHGSRSMIVDWAYKDDRPNDDLVPLQMAAMSHTSCETVPLVLDGGNLLSNGQGLCVTTTTMFDFNTGPDVDEETVYRQVKAHLGARQLVVLEPLVGESTGHVDMFLTFTGPRTVVLGAYSYEDDEENAAVLDRNAGRLADVQLPDGRLRVERIPMGNKIDGLWRTYTNCVYANRALLVPSYRNDQPARFEHVMSVYRRLLPQWQIVPVDATDLIQDGGALHCAALNISALARPLQPLPAAFEPPIPRFSAAPRLAW